MRNASHDLDHLDPDLPFRVVVVQDLHIVSTVQPRKHAVDHADSTSPIRQHELTSQIRDICAVKDLLIVGYKIIQVRDISAV